MFDPALQELLFTVAASTSLVVLFLGAAAVLPWTEQELDEVEEAFRSVASPACPVSAGRY